MSDVDLSDLGFDFEGYFDRWENKRLSEEEMEDFDARVIGLFCRRMLIGGTATGQWSRWEDFAAYLLAKKLRPVTGGVRWVHAFDLAHEPRQSEYTRVGQRALDAYCSIENERRANPSRKITDILQDVATGMNVSYESVRDGYYLTKKAIEKKEGLPDRFLKKDPDI